MPDLKFHLVSVDYSKPYDEQPECHRHVIGAYANLARHNMTLTVNTIMQAIGMSTFNENEISSAFNKSHRKKLGNLDNIKKVNLQKRLYRHFPFFKRMKLENEDKKTVQLDTMLEVMADFTSCMSVIRNFNTHYNPYNSDAEKESQRKLMTTMGRRLQYLYENTCQLFKSNEALDHEANEVLAALRIPEDYIQVIKPGDSEYKKTSDFYFNPKISQQKKKGIKFIPETKVFEKKAVKYVRNPEYQAYMMDDDKGLSDIGIVYFICLFLDKQQAFSLMDEVGFSEQIRFHGEDAAKQLLYMKEIMCMNRIRMIKSKLDSEMTDTALALDMISEIRKCPKPLYEVFGKEAREEFKDDATVIWENEHGEEAILTEDTREDEENQENETPNVKNTPRSTFVRWDDRFPQMALRYIDLTGMFSDIRFQLNLGKYRFAFYTHDKHHSVDGEERLRILQKEMHGFGRPLEVDQYKDQKWGEIYERKTVENGLTFKDPDEAGKAPYVTNQRAQYAIDERSNSIGLRWEGWDNSHAEKHYGDLNKEKMFIPYLPTKLTQATNEARIRYQGEKLLAPQLMLSLYDLPGIIFYNYLLCKYNKDKSLTEKNIKEYYLHISEFLTDLNTGELQPIAGGNKDELERMLMEKYELHLSYIPDKLVKYLLGISVDNSEKLKESAFRRLNERKQHVQLKLDKYKEARKKIGSNKNKFDRMRASIKTGVLAQTLIRDIADWLPMDSVARTKLTGQSYTALQSDMAMLGQRFETEDGIREMTLTDLKEAFIKAQIIADATGEHSAMLHHPFLHLVFRDYIGDSIEGFYEMYLTKEIRYIENTVNFLEKADDNSIRKRYRFVPFLHSNRSRWEEKTTETVKAMAARYMERPMPLPSGLFSAPIYNLLSEIATIDTKNGAKLKGKLEEAKQAEKGTPLKDNVAYLINLYFNIIERDHSQHFYNTAAIEGKDSPYRHVYRIFKKLYENPDTSKDNPPAYTIDELRELRKTAQNDICNFVEDEVANWKDRQSYNFKRDIRKKLKKENDRRYKNREKQMTYNEIENLINEAVQEEVCSMREELLSKMSRQLKKVYDNEREIRRYKTQDILMLIMAREILKSKSQDEDFTDGFQLKYVMTDSLLDKQIDFKWNVIIPDGNNGTVKKAVEQKSMKMKNYGQFYKFATDHQRLESLLSRLPQSVFLRSEIENEFAYYDTNRSEVFRLVYIIESEAYKLKPELMDDRNANEPWFSYTDKRGTHPIRNSFIQLLEILAAGEDGVLDEKEKTAMQNTRNAFGHNTYDIDLETVFEGKEEKMKIPEVANGIKVKIEEQTDELKKKIK